jgi:ATP-binding cassette subfamily B protein
VRAEQLVVGWESVEAVPARFLPAIVVTENPDGFTHFVVVWRIDRRSVWLMDPAVGHRRVARAAFAGDVYRLAQPVPEAAWRDWVVGEEATVPLLARLVALGVEQARARALLDAALGAADPAWAVARLDAAVRATARLGEPARVAAPRLVRTLVAADEAAAGGVIAERDWPVTRAEPDEEGEAMVAIRGAVIVATRGVDGDVVVPAALGAVLGVSGDSPRAALLRLLRPLAPRVVAAVVAVVVASVLGVVEVLLVRPFLDGDTGRVGALLAVVVVASLVLVVPVLAGLWAGRVAEARLLSALLGRVALLGDGFYRTRAASDLAERAYGLERVRDGVDTLRVVAERVSDTLVSLVALVVIAPAAWWAVLVLGVVLGLVRPVLRGVAETDLRARALGGALSVQHADALLGAAVVRAHGGAPALAGRFGATLAAWRQAARRLADRQARAQLVVAVLGAGATGLVAVAVADGGASRGTLLVAALLATRAVSSSRDAAGLLRRIAPLRSALTRVAEPLCQPLVDEPPPPLGSLPRGAVALRVRGDVRSGGSVLLGDVDVALLAGEQVALVGASGAGKSSLLAAVLGWLPVDELVVDGEPATAARLAALRASTAWLDPQVRLWNAPIADNLAYGAAVTGDDERLQQARLLPVAERLAGAPLGEAGGLVSGGEGQRVRFARALGRPDARLVVLDEPFRGLDRETRQALLAEARDAWREATMLCATHDIADAARFGRVLVVDDGRIVEDGDPALLARDPESRLAGLLRAEERVQALFDDPAWRRLTVRDGRVGEEQPA